MPDNEPHGPDGFPLCSKCGAQRRSSNEYFPGLCQECITKLDEDERAKTVADAQAKDAETAGN